MAGKYRNSGQTCVTANRIMVQRNIYNEFVQKFIAESKKLKVQYTFWMSSPPTYSPDHPHKVKLNPGLTFEKEV